jgi:hypothetical protein
MRRADVENLIYLIIIVLIFFILLVVVSSIHAQDKPCTVTDTSSWRYMNPSTGECVTPPTKFGSVHVTLYDDANNRTKWTLPVPHRTADRKFLAFAAADLALTVADLENTHWVTQHGGIELNPAYGKHPSRDRLYLVGGGFWALTTYMSWRYKRIHDAEVAFGVRPPRPAWYWFNVLDGGSHAFGLVFTLGATGR